MKFSRTATAALLAACMSFAAVSAELKQSSVVVHAEEPDPKQLQEYAEIIINQVNDARLAEQGVQLNELQMLPVMCDYAQVRAVELPFTFDHKRPAADYNGNFLPDNINKNAMGYMVVEKKVVNDAQAISYETIPESVRMEEDGSFTLMDADGNTIKKLKAGEDGLPVFEEEWRLSQKLCFTVIKEDGFWYNSAAENIAAGNVLPLQTFDQWMNSPSHRGNIMGDFTHIGIGYFYDPNSQYKYYWSMFLVKVLDAEGKPNVYDGQYIPPREPGDVNGSHTIDSTDAARILQYDSEFNAGLSIRITDSFRAAADLNSDGEVNAVDASILLSYIAAQGADPEAQLEDFIW